MNATSVHLPKLPMQQLGPLRGKSIHMVVVSKSQPLEVVSAAIAAGVPALGENYVEEAVEKIAALKESAGRMA